MTIEQMFETGVFPGARVGSCRAAQRYGTVESILSNAAIVIAWDDGRRGLVPWTAISPLGYVAENVAQIAA